MNRAERRAAAREETVGAPKRERLWVGWVLRLHPDGGVVREHVRLPQSVVEAHRVREPETPMGLPYIAAQLSRELVGEGVAVALARAEQEGGA